MTGLVLSGSWNIFIVKPDEADGTVECRIKGKVLRDAETFRNPIAPGDRVVFKTDGGGRGLVLALEERRNIFTRSCQSEGKRNRHDKSRPKSQILAANADLVLCVCTPASPPFRPRFIDRLLVQAEASGVDPMIVVNKSDIPADSTAEARLMDFSRIGYRVIRTSAKTGLGIDELRRLVNSKLSLLMGQSGVGKSSIINALASTNIKTKAVNEKYDRGNHTTTLASLTALPKGWIIDTPGVRVFTPDRVSADQLTLFMREFAPFTGQCYFGLSCSHTTETGCKVREAVENGGIYPDRYESFLRIREELRPVL
ncbi:MAG: ribosome small subunit-dependent GTPase A [Treponema sp.]|jgi:ribosome biogenesis GTPase|nr:ribosome small subunit-dependent GTPase A [Treponema sp.]